MTVKPRVFVISGVAWNTMVYLDEWPDVAQGSGPALGWHQTIGGTGAGKSMNMHRLGFDVDFLSYLGSDAYAAEIKRSIESWGINAHWVEYQGASEQHINLMLANGERRSIFLEQEPERPLVWTEDMAKMWDRAEYRWVNIKSCCLALLSEMQRQSGDIWVDLHDYREGDAYHMPFIAVASHIITSNERLISKKHFMEEMLNQGKKLVVVTDGAKGLSAMTETGSYFEIPAVKVDCIRDTNGAGDAFCAGLMLGLSRMESMAVSLQMGACAGAIAVSSRELSDPAMSQSRLLDTWAKHFGSYSRLR